MKKSPRLLRSLVFLLLLLPLAFQVMLLGIGALVAILVRAINSDGIGAIFAWIIGLAGGVFFLYVCFRAGRSLVQRAYPKNNDSEDGAASGGLVTIIPSPSFSIRYLGVVIMCIYTMLIALVGIFLPVGRHGVFENFEMVFIYAHSPSMFLPGILLAMARAPLGSYFIIPSVIYIVYAAGMAWEFRIMQMPRTRWMGRVVCAAIVVVWGAAFMWRADRMERDVLRGKSAGTRMEDRIYTEPYIPFRADNKLVEISEPTYTISKEHPRLDGATALYPVYAAAVQAIYTNIRPPDVWNIVNVTTTPRAYERLINGEVDMIFCAKPSPEQIAAAKEKGIEFQLIPLGREAFVFFVNEANPVDGLTSQQVRAIYTRKITNWSEVGGHDEKILPFQRPKDSGSQTAMEQQVMRGRSMTEPLREEQIRGMGGIILETAAYRNSTNAIGYSFRFFVTTMTGVKDVKLLKIDGVAPTVETIRDGTYPYAGEFYAVVTNKTNNSYVVLLIAWFLSEQGQKLIEDAGYVPLGPK